MIIDYANGIMNRGGVMEDTTTSYSLKEIKHANVDIILKEVSKSLKEKNYNANSQLVGYLMSGDPGYISSYQNARGKITSIDRSQILEFLLSKAIGEDKWDI